MGVTAARPWEQMLLVLRLQLSRWDGTRGGSPSSLGVVGSPGGAQNCGDVVMGMVGCAGL